MTEEHSPRHEPAGDRPEERETAGEVKAIRTPATGVTDDQGRDQKDHANPEQDQRTHQPACDNDSHVGYTVGSVTPV